MEQEFNSRPREHARFAKAADVRKLSLMPRMMVLIFRHRVGGDDLKKLDGKALFALGVEKGWIGKDGVDRLEIGEVTVCTFRKNSQLAYARTRKINRLPNFPSLRGFCITHGNSRRLPFDCNDLRH